MTSIAEEMRTVGVFLDRDGTINEEVGYVNHIDRFALLPGAVEAIRELNRFGLKVILITNQSGVARGYFPEKLLKAVHEKLCSMVEAAGGHLDGIYYCPHHPVEGKPPYRKDCHCRKPKIGMLQTASDELEIDLERSYVIGDRLNDIKLANNAGSKGVLVLTGYGKGEWENHRKKGPSPWKVAKDIQEAVQLILEDVRSMIYQST
jgi:D-glycero-D-manno-heptose 1,7-bisphosphate phosphatase